MELTDLIRMAGDKMKRKKTKQTNKKDINVSY